jgi:hypothetical protein
MPTNNDARLELGKKPTQTNFYKQTLMPDLQYKDQYLLPTNIDARFAM